MGLSKRCYPRMPWLIIHRVTSLQSRLQAPFVLPWGSWLAHGWAKTGNLCIRGTDDLLSLIKNSSIFIDSSWISHDFNDFRTNPIPLTLNTPQMIPMECGNSRQKKKTNMVSLNGGVFRMNGGWDYSASNFIDSSWLSISGYICSPSFLHPNPNGDFIKTPAWNRRCDSSGPECVAMENHHV